jgi:hypothetical protein
VLPLYFRFPYITLLYLSYHVTFRGGTIINYLPAGVTLNVISAGVTPPAGVVIISAGVTRSLLQSSKIEAKTRSLSLPPFATFYPLKMG